MTQNADYERLRGAFLSLLGSAERALDQSESGKRYDAEDTLTNAIARAQAHIGHGARA